MANPDNTPAKQPAVADLLAQYLRQRTEDRAAGLVSKDAAGEVVPFEAAPVQTVDPRLAWDEALAALKMFGEGSTVKAPPDWPMVVASQEPAVALAFAVGNFPQLVRHVQPLLHAKLTELRPSAGRPIAVPELTKWATQTAKKKQFPETLLAIGALRLARQFDKVDELITKQRGEVPAEWQSAFANEEAALAWHRGQANEALKLWRSQPESVPVLFNRGMAALFTGKSADARAALQQAVAKLSEESAWHHLGRLYLALS